MTQKKFFLTFRYAAIKRYGDYRWSIPDSDNGGQIEFNPNYTVSCSSDETGLLGDAENTAFVVELSNGTKFITFQHNADRCGDEVLSDEGEYANANVPESCYEYVRRNIGLYARAKSPKNN